MNSENDDDKELLLDTPLEEAGEEPQVEAPEDEGDEIFLDIEGEDPEDGTHAMRMLRDRERALTRENYELKRAQQNAQPAIDPGPKPTLEGCDWDEDRLSKDLIEWHENTRKAESARNQQAERQRVNDQEFERLKLRHQQRAEFLNISNFKEAEEAVVDAIGPELAGAALVIADDSAKLVAAIGKNPAALAKLAAEPNPLLKLKMLMKLESKIVTKKKAPTPDAATITRSTTSVAPAGEDKQAAKLLEKAQKTGNMNEYRAYMKSKRAA